MMEIGKNLQYEKFALESLSDSILAIKSASHHIQEIDVTEIDQVEIVGIARNSGVCGSMEYGMTNPTFLLPTNFLLNILSAFKKRNDTVHIKVSLQGAKEFIVLGDQTSFKTLQKLTSKS